MRIGILTHNYPASSKERRDAGVFIYDFAHALAKEHEIFVFCLGVKFQGDRDTLVPVTWGWGDDQKFGQWSIFNPKSIIRFVKLVFSGAKESQRFVREKKLDFLLCCWAIPSGLFGFISKIRIGIPYGVWCLGSDLTKYIKFPVLRQLITLSLVKADLRFSNSYELMRIGKRVSKKKFIFMPAITNLGAKIIPRKSKNKKFNFLFVGRLERVKGPDILLQAVYFLSKSRKDFNVHLLGEGSLLPQLKKAVKKLRIEDFVVFHGWADKEEVCNFMATSDALVIPSRSESLPLVLLEAAKFRLPVISSNVGDCKRIVDGYGIGFTVPRENPGELYKAMFKIMKEASVDKRGFEKLNKDFSQENAVRILVRELKKI